MTPNLLAFAIIDEKRRRSARRLELRFGMRPDSAKKHLPNAMNILSVCASNYRVHTIVRPASLLSRQPTRRVRTEQLR